MPRKTFDQAGEAAMEWFTPRRAFIAAVSLVAACWAISAAFPMGVAS